MPWMTYALAAFIVVGLILIVFSTVRVRFAKPYLPAVICGISVGHAQALVLMGAAQSTDHGRNNRRATD